MVDALYAVKVNWYDGWPFALFKDIDSAITCVVSIYPDAEPDELEKLICRIPAFESYKMVGPDDGMRCSEVVG